MCPCECNSGGFCGGCGHAGCGGRRRLSVPTTYERRMFGVLVYRKTEVL